jgi:mono/diheme cytochrome c family protein
MIMMPRLATSTLAALGVLAGIQLAAHAPIGNGAHPAAQTSDAAAANDVLVEEGRRAFAQHDCLHCHSLAGQGGQMGPELLGVAARRTPEWLVRHFVDPDRESPTTLMPAFGPEPVARGLTAFLQTLRTPADAGPLIAPFLEGGQRLRALPAAMIDSAALTSGHQLLLRFNARDELIGIRLEDWRRDGDRLVLRREHYDRREKAPGWRRYTDDRVTLNARTLTIEAQHTVMDGVVHDVTRSDDAVTLTSTRPGTSRAWAETRILPQPLYDASDRIVAAITLAPGQRAAYWIFGAHGGAVPRIVAALDEESPAGTMVVQVSTAGTHDPSRWIRVRAGQPLFTSYGATPDTNSRLVPADDGETRRWVAALAADAGADWVHGLEPSLLESWRHD